MGTLRSKRNHTGEVVNDVVLGDPVILTADGQQASEAASMDDLYFCWDDAALPSGEMVDGEVVSDG